MGPEHKVNKNRPEVLEGSVEWYHAFQHLTFTRPAGMNGAMPLLLTEMEAYCRIMEIPPRDRPAFMRILRRIDLDYLDLIEKRKTATATKVET